MSIFKKDLAEAGDKGGMRVHKSFVVFDILSSVSHRIKLPQDFSPNCSIRSLGTAAEHSDMLAFTIKPINITCKRIFKGVFATTSNTCSYTLNVN